MKHNKYDKQFEHCWVAYVTEKNRIHVNIRIGSANVDVILNNFVIKVLFCFCFTFSIFHYVEK